MPIYKSIRVEKPVYDSLVALLLPRETYSQLIQRLVNFHNAVKLDVVLAGSPLKGEKEVK
jgi:predicted CopG family antitoxin